MTRKTPLCFHEPPRWPQEIYAYGEHILVVGRWHFLVESRSEGGFHCVDLESFEESGDQHCTCRSGETRKTCRHEAAVRRAFGLDNA